MPRMIKAAALKNRCEEVLKTVSCKGCKRENAPDDLCNHCEVKICNDTIAVIDAYDAEVSKLQKANETMCVECTWKKQALDINHIPNANGGACFHGEVWMRCPKCDKAYEMHGMKPFMEKDGYVVYQCECGQLFKDR